MEGGLNGMIFQENMEAYRSLCKVLLTKDMVSSKMRKATGNLLGSETEQEAYFFDAKLCEDLANLYIRQARNDKLFDLYDSLGELDAAFRVARMGKLLSDSVFEKRVIEILHYLWAGCVTEHTVLEFQSELWDLSTTKVRRQHEQWQAGTRCIAQPKEFILLESVLVEEDLVLDFLCTQVSKLKRATWR